MLLGDFIKELKHNSTHIIVFLEKLFDFNLLFEGTLGVLKNNIYYQREWSSCKILEVKPMYEENFKVKISFTICEPYKEE